MAHRSDPAVAGATASPNIWYHPDVYERENRAADPDRHLWAALLGVRPWAGATVVDIGCGTGYFLPAFADAVGPTGRVYGVEPHHRSRATAARRLAGSGEGRVTAPGLAAPSMLSAASGDGVDSAGDVARHLITGATGRPAATAVTTVHAGTADRLPLPDASVDVAHARFAYFFGPGCEPGLAELRRVVRRGGVAVVIDIDATRSEYGRWFRLNSPGYDPDAVMSFFSARGWSRTPVDMDLQFARSSDLADVLGIEFAPQVAARAVAEVGDRLRVGYAVNLWTLRL